jgi:hypothetical protein
MMQSNIDRMFYKQKRIGVKSKRHPVIQYDIYEYYISITFSGSASQSGLWPPHSRGFVITQRRTTVGRTPLNE